jgi:hypothetical protein
VRSIGLPPREFMIRLLRDRRATFSAGPVFLLFSVILVRFFFFHFVFCQLSSTSLQFQALFRSPDLIVSAPLPFFCLASAETFSHAGEHQKKHALAVLRLLSRKTRCLRGQHFDKYLRRPLCINSPPHYFHLLKHSTTILKNYRIE